MWRPETNDTHESFNIVRKGYDREAVDRLLAALRQELSQASERIAKLEVELSQARQAHETLREDTRLALSDPERASKLLGQEASEVLKSANDAALGLRRKAESTAKDLVERARREAEEITRQAKLAAESEIEEGRQVARAHLEEVRQQGREILAMADSTAASTVEAAKREGRSLVFRAREHAANLTQQAENRAAQVREEISGLDLERQHLIGILRGAQDLVRSSLASLDTRPLFPEHAATEVPTGENEHDTTPTSEEPGTVDVKLRDLPTAESVDGDALNHVTKPTENADTTPVEAGVDTTQAALTLADVTKLIELAAEQTAAFELDDEEDYLIDRAVDDRVIEEPSTLHSDDQGTETTESPSSDLRESKDIRESKSSEVAAQEPQVSVQEPSTSEDDHPTPLHEIGEADASSTDAAFTPSGVSDTGAGQEPQELHDATEFEDEIVVVERYRQPRPEATTPDNSKSRLQRLEALFSELREEDADHSVATSRTMSQPSPVPAATSDDSDAAVPDDSVVDPLPESAQNLHDSETDHLAQKIRGALKDLFDPRTVDLSRRIKRITQDDLNKILATLRSSGRDSAISLIDQIINDSQTRAGDVRLLVARILHAGSDFGALLGDQRFDPSGQRFDELSQEMAIDLTDALGQATLVRALEILERSSELDEMELVARTNGVYREARRKLDELISDNAYQIFCRGVRLVPGATGYLWVTSSATQPCADCEDNMLAGINPLAEAFPTGHENPPAHPGCTCVIVPVFA
ncbi:MAG: hypothetical protein ACP5HZ_02660 [Ferrimicrobium sp.]